MSVSVLVLPACPQPRSSGGSAFGVRLAAAIGEVLDAVPAHPTFVVLASGSEPLVEDVTALALPERTISVAGAPEIVAAVVERGQVPRVQAAALRGSAGALAAILQAARPDARFVGVTIPAFADPAALEGIIAALRGALDAHDDVVVAAPGDLGAGDADRAATDHTLAAALREGVYADDAAALVALADRHPELASALAPVRVALGIAHARGQRLIVHADAVLDGTLQVVAADR